MAAMSRIKFSFFLVLFVLCPLDSAQPAQMPIAPAQMPIAPAQMPIAPAQMPIAPAPMPIAPAQIPIAPAQMPVAPPSSLKFNEDALFFVLYYSGLTPQPPVSRSFCINKPSRIDITITCSTSKGTDNEWHITEIIMSNVRLNGFIHGAISKLKYLQTLDLSSNQLTGIIPSSLGDLKNLMRLDLSSNQLTGIIPPSLGYLKNLRNLYLTMNFLTGIIPPSLGKLNSLETLDLWCNKLSGAIPHELGDLSQLQTLSLDDNELNGTLPKELRKLSNLRQLWLTSNYLTGEVPKEYEQLVSLEEFAVAGNNMSGRIPPFIAKWENLRILFTGELPSEIFNMTSLEILRVSDLKSTGFAFPSSANLPSIEILVLRNCGITGQIPSFIGYWNSSLRRLDLSFNNLTGRIPDSFEHLHLETMLLTRNKLSGEIPDWVNNKMITRVGDFSYNYFEVKGPGMNNVNNSNINREPSANYMTSPSQNHCNGNNSQYHSLFINAGGEAAYIEGKHYDADNISSNTFYKDPTKRWAYVCSGDFFSTTANSSDYIRNITCGVSSPEATLYDKARICPQSLTYYGFCLQKGVYTVKLHFAEIVFSKDEDYSSLGKRVFDIYIQGKREIEDFNIKKEAGGPNKRCTKIFKAKVDHNLLEIRLFWAGKGSLYNPPALNGPLISAISVTPDFEIGGLSTKWIVGIVVAAVSTLVLASLLLWAFMWRMGWVGDRELINTIVKIRDIEYSLKEVIAATGNFSPQNEIAATGNFGPQNEMSQTVYKAKLRDQKNIVVVKKLSLYTKQFDQITNEDTKQFDQIKNEVYAGQKLKHDNLVELLAVCSNKKKKISLIIYEYMENGSLQQALFDDSNVQGQLDWQRRVKICLGIAKGLEYLHELATGKIIHRNIKASKVLLDENFNAKVSDLGLAMLYGEDEPYDFLQKIAAGVTYMAPEVLRRESITDKADVYSYGIVLLEIISGQSNSKHEGKKETESLLERAAVLHKRGSYSEMVDQKLTDCDMKQFVGIFDLAMRCVDQTPALRPKMSEVVSELEKI